MLNEPVLLEEMGQTGGKGKHSTHALMKTKDSMFELRFYVNASDQRATMKPLGSPPFSRAVEPE